MDYINVLFFIVIIAPLSMLTHEIGHLVGAKLVEAEEVTLTLGTGKTLFTIRLNQTTFIVRFFLLFNPQAQSIKSEGFKKNELIIISLFGPLFNLILALCTYIIMSYISPTYLLYVFYFNLWLGLINLIPFKIKEQKSDGYLIFQQLNLIKSNE